MNGPPSLDGIGFVGNQALPRRMCQEWESPSHCMNACLSAEFKRQQKMWHFAKYAATFPKYEILMSV